MIFGTSSIAGVDWLGITFGLGGIEEETGPQEIPPGCRTTALSIGHRLSELAVSERFTILAVGNRFAEMSTCSGPTVAGWHEGDTLPALEATLKLNGEPYEIPVNAVVRLVYRRGGDLSLTTRDCEIVNAATGDVRYEWQAGELVAGTYQSVLVVEHEDGGLESFRNQPFVVRPLL